MDHPGHEYFAKAPRTEERERVRKIESAQQTLLLAHAKEDLIVSNNVFLAHANKVST